MYGRDRVQCRRLSPDQERGEKPPLRRAPALGPVRALLEAAQQALADGAHPVEHGEVALELVVVAPEQASSDATNHLRGIGDVLQAKTASPLVEHLGPLARVSLFANDSQVREISYREERGPEPMYRLVIRPREPTHG